MSVKQYWTSEYWQWENGLRVDLVAGVRHSSDPEKAFVPVYPAADYEALLSLTRRLREQLMKHDSNDPTEYDLLAEAKQMLEE